LYVLNLTSCVSRRQNGRF